MSMRIAIVGLSIEIMLASPQQTDWDALQHYSSRDISEGDVWMIRGMFDRLRAEPDVEAVPLYWATALPGGAMTADAYQRIKDKTLRLLKAEGPFEGVLVANHGALEVADLSRDADTDFVTAIRAFVGPDIPIGVSLDLHGDMTFDLLRAATVFSVLRTAPHRDDRQTGYRAADQLLRVLRQGLKPRKAAVSIPILVPGETAVTNMPPAEELYGGLAALDGRDGLLESNILVGFAWNDRPWTAVTALAVSDGDLEVARRAAIALAERIWAQRHEFKLRMETAEVEEGLRRAVACREKPVYVSDSGDNTTAGAAGDLTLVLQAALRGPSVRDIIVAGITAPKTVAQLMAAGIGSEVEIELGSEHISRPRTALRVQAIVEACGNALELPGFQPYRSVESAWARVSIGEVQATFHARSIGVTTPHHFRAMGVDPTAHKVYVVKLGYLHPQLEDIRARHILLLSDGTSQLDMTRLHWETLPRPTIPLDKDFNWQATDALYTD
jgi:microcystin degradation protein MlrC